MQNKCCGLSWRRQIKSILVVSQSSSRKELLAQTPSGGMGEQQSKIKISPSGAERAEERSQTGRLKMKWCLRNRQTNQGTVQKYVFLFIFPTFDGLKN